VTAELPLFPLSTVLFPGGPLSLRIFETRYLDMVASVLRGDNRFGVVAIRSGSEVGEAETFTVGTTAEIVDWQDAGGLLSIRAVGRDSFTIESSHRRPDGLYVGSVQWLDEPPATPLPPEHAKLSSLLETVLKQLPIYAGVATAYDDAVWVGARLAEILPFTLVLKQSLLEMREPVARLDKIAAGLGAESSLA
jgi:Lon protease-like protein